MNDMQSKVQMTASHLGYALRIFDQGFSENTDWWYQSGPLWKVYILLNRVESSLSAEHY